MDREGGEQRFDPVVRPLDEPVEHLAVERFGALPLCEILIGIDDVEADFEPSQSRLERVLARGPIVARIGKTQNVSGLRADRITSAASTAIGRKNNMEESKAASPTSPIGERNRLKRL